MENEALDWEEDDQELMLADVRHGTLRVRCLPCSRFGQFQKKALLAQHGNPNMALLARLIAIDGGCTRACENMGKYCLARMVVRASSKSEPILHTALHERWRLDLACDRQREGMKSTKPCMGSVTIDVVSLVAAYGHEMPLSRLPSLMSCPRCGSKHFRLLWMRPVV